MTEGAARQRPDESNKVTLFLISSLEPTYAVVPGSVPSYKKIMYAYK